MTTRILGASLTLVDTQPSREPNGLATITYFYEGTDTAVNLAILALPRDYGYRKSSAEAPKVSLQVIVPNATDTVSNEEMAFHWEMPGNDDVKSLLEHPTVLGFIPKLQDALRTTVKNESNRTYLERVADLTAAASNYGFRGREGVVIGFFNNILNEQAYILPQYVLRLNQTIGSRYSKSIADPNIARIYSTAQIVAEAATNLCPITDRIKYKLEHIDPPVVGGRVVDPDYTVNNFTWGWLKKSSTENQVAGGRIEIQTEWVLDMWSELTYRLAA